MSRRALLLHMAVVVWVPGCAIAAWWQVTIALAGDHLAYLYSVEWPCFAVFGAVVWWNLVHDDPDTVGVRGLRRAQRTTVSGEPVGVVVPVPDDERLRMLEEQDPELAAYNDYLARLASGDASVSRRSR